MFFSFDISSEILPFFLGGSSDISFYRYVECQWDTQLVIIFHIRDKVAYRKCLL